MDVDTVRSRASAFCDAIVAGDVDKAAEAMSEQLRRNLGEVIALLPLPASEAGVESVDHSGSGYNVVIRVIGESDEADVQTRWKDRDGEPTMVEASHLSRTARAEPEPDALAAETGEPTGAVQP
jgi:hypothetical protein